MATLTLTVPSTFYLDDMESEVLASVGDRLRDDYGYERSGAVSRDSSANRDSYPLSPAGAIVVEKKADRLIVKLHGVEADSHDLFRAVSSDLEQRHEGVSAEID